MKRYQKIKYGNELGALGLGTEKSRTRDENIKIFQRF